MKILAKNQDGVWKKQRKFSRSVQGMSTPTKNFNSALSNFVEYSVCSVDDIQNQKTR